MQYGVVRKVSFDRGFGFIQRERGPDVWFHATAVAEGAFNRIGPDQAVKFELEPRPKDAPPDDRGPRASLVQLIDRIPGGILQPTPTGTVKHHPKARQKKPTWRKPS